MTCYRSLAEFWYLAEHVTGINAATLIRASRVELAEWIVAIPHDRGADLERDRGRPVGLRRPGGTSAA